MPAHAILKLSRQDIETVTNLKETLQQERLALENSDAESLEALLSDKTSQLNQINDNARRRSELLAALGFPNDRDGMQSFIATLPQEERTELSALWDNLETTLEECKEHNLINARVLQHTRGVVDRLLTIYRGSAAKSVSLYGEDGTQTRDNEHRSITKA
ncbi:flagellar protein FlgN [Aestuariirhabdus sp. Z084]|uniref:flagella synthesis protein FlgN n=1 Tax=Aestuariirhabdus haliotis TaxID=2918751 RepID=UPI00201B375B|nr:flagellar protein FlgN [Aestuariirhabdus haliotis]MCL6414435.1 flagellar protein FlgN [Aestuariirhabdus haliotis]MCL6418583.1 flagellar protein FlgN [Aestuariirhabdus haliotis]